MFLISLSGLFHIWDAFTQVWRRLQWRFWHVSVSKDAQEISKLLSTIVHRCTVHKDALCIMMHCALWCTIHYALCTMCVSVSLKMHKKLLSTMHSALRCTMHYPLSTIMHYDALCTMHCALCTMHCALLCTMHCALWCTMMHYALWSTIHCALRTMRMSVFINMRKRTRNSSAVLEQMPVTTMMRMLWWKRRW